MNIKPNILANAESLIEYVFPAQKISFESFKEQSSNTGKTLTSLGSYWKGRKPLILNKACILGLLLPKTDNLEKDLEIFEMLMGMDDDSLIKRYNFNTSKTKYIDFDTSKKMDYRTLISKSLRPEECKESLLYSHIWEKVNNHLGTNASSIKELINQLGIMRFGNNPIVADCFSGSGQIPFESARLGCDTYASDLNPIACLLTWGSFNIVGANIEEKNKLEKYKEQLVLKVSEEINKLGIESDNNGWQGKAYLYCLETKCPHSGYMVPMIPNLIVSKTRKAIAVLVPNKNNKNYDICIKSGVSEQELNEANKGTIVKDGKESYLIHTIEGIEYRTKISTIRGDYIDKNKTSKNNLRLWEKKDFKPKDDDIYQERLYAIQWMKQKENSKLYDYEFRTVTEHDLKNEKIIENYIEKNFTEWQNSGIIPDMKIEDGFNTKQPIWEKGWTYWHQLFNPRQLLTFALINKYIDNELAVFLPAAINFSSKLSMWHNGLNVDAVVNMFSNQALNTLFNYGCRGHLGLLSLFKILPAQETTKNKYIINDSAKNINYNANYFITDPPYGDAVHYEEIYDVFIAWLRRKNIPEFKNWVWDSRKALAIKGEDHKFKVDMIDAYKNMSNHMPSNGRQVIMFTHQSGELWADMASIIWGAGLQVTAAWYIATETESALRQGANVKGTIILILKKREGNQRITEDDLAWEIAEEVKQQISLLTGLNHNMASSGHRTENMFTDADLQMAGYAAALKVLTSYSIINGKDMIKEALLPRIKGVKTTIDELIDFAVKKANEELVPDEINHGDWESITPIERYYLKMLDLYSKNENSLDNFQNFAKAYKVPDYKIIMQSQKANNPTVKSAIEFGKLEMGDSSIFGKTLVRSVLFAIKELYDAKDVEGYDEALKNLIDNYKNYYNNKDIIVRITDFIIKKFDVLGYKDDASNGRVIKGLIQNQRI